MLTPLDDLSLIFSAFPIGFGGKVQFARLTQPGGAVCLTSDKGTKVSKLNWSVKSSSVHSF